MYRSRTSIHDLPNWISPCWLEKACVYRDNKRNCDKPRTNKGNGDAACHRMNNRDVLAMLQKSDQQRSSAIVENFIAKELGK